MQILDLSPRKRFWSLGAAALVVLLVGTAVYSLSGLSRERRHTQELTAANEALTASLRHVQNQLQSVSDRLSALTSQPITAPEAARVQERTPSRTPARPRRSVNTVEERRWKQLQAKLAEQQRQIDTAREETSQARKDLQDSLNATRDDLQGSIARTHDEVVVLQKRGERNYHEFEIEKSKQFHAVGPLSVSLRKVNLKQGHYDVVLVVDDRQLEKKHVNLYEPLMFTLADRPQPIELVVNHISKNEVKGYVSEPKYKKAELAAAAPPLAAPAANNPKALQRR
jgi:hypothetical protein